MDEPIFSLVIQATVYGLFNLGFKVLLRRPMISAAVAFWFGWIFLLGGGLISERSQWASFTTEFSVYLEKMFFGAFVGFSIGTFIVHKDRRASTYKDLVLLSERFINKYGRKVLIVLFSVGVIFFIQRLMVVGLGADYLTEVRAIYNERGDFILLQIGSHLSILATMFIMLRGVYDSYYGINFRALLLVIVSGAPLGLANGGRAFLMSYFLAYLSSFLLCRSNFIKVNFNVTTRECLLMALTLAGLLSIFAIMGFLRGGYGDQFNIFYTIIIWPVSTLGAMDSWVYSAMVSERTYGLNTFGWIVDFMSRIGLIDVSASTKVIRDTVSFFQETSNSAAVIPRSILPDLIYDFGVDSIFISMLLMALLLELITSRYAAAGIFLHVLAAQCLIASFSTIQNSVLTPGFVATLFWAAIFSRLATRYRWH